MAHNSDVAEMTHDMTRHDIDGMFMLVVVSMSSRSAIEWWMCSSCIIASPPHGKVCRVFDGLGVRLMLRVHVSTLLVIGMLHVFIRSWTSLLACAPCSSLSSSRHISSMYRYPQSLMMRWHQIEKSPSLPWCSVFRFRVQLTGREDKALKLRRAHFRPGCGLHPLSRKIMQRSLGVWDGQFRSVMTVCGIWLGWRADLRNFSREALQAGGRTLAVKVEQIL